jgi:hypothetical protein
MDIKRIILEELDSFEWVKDIPNVDIYKPQVGYVYKWDGYTSLFTSPDDDGPISDEIVIKNVDDVGRTFGRGPYSVYEFDTVNNYWGLSHLDGIDSHDFTRRIKDGSITFIREE